MNTQLPEITLEKGIYRYNPVNYAENYWVYDTKSNFLRIGDIGYNNLIVNTVILQSYETKTKLATIMVDKYVGKIARFFLLEFKCDWDLIERL